MRTRVVATISDERGYVMTSREIEQQIDEADAEGLSAMTGQGFRVRKTPGPHGYATAAGPRRVRGGLGRQGASRSAALALPSKSFPS